MNRKSISLALLSIIFIHTFEIGMFIPAVASILSGQDFGITSGFKSTEYGIFGTTFIYLIAPVYFFSAPFIGSCSDHLGRKRILLFSLLIAFIGYFISLISIAMDIYSLLVIGCLFTTLSPVVPVTIAAMSDVTIGKQRLNIFMLVAYGLFAFYLIGIIISGLLLNGAYFSTLKHVNADILLFISLLQLIMTILTFRFLPETRKGNNLSSLQVFADVPTTMIEITQRKSLMIIIVLIFAFQYAWDVSLYSISYIAINQHITANQAIIYVSAVLIAMLIILSLIILFINHRGYYPKFNLIKNALLVMAFGLVGIFIFHSIWSLSIFLTLFSIGENIVFALLWYFLTCYAGKEHQGLLIGLAGSAWLLALVTSTLSANMLAKLNHYYPATLSLIFITFIVLWMKYLRKENNDSAIQNIQE